MLIFTNYTSLYYTVLHCTTLTLTEEENRVNFEDEASEEFEVLVDDNYPGQFRVVGTKIEKVSLYVYHILVDICPLYMLMYTHWTLNTYLY